MGSLKEIKPTTPPFSKSSTSFSRLGYEEWPASAFPTRKTCRDMLSFLVSILTPLLNEIGMHCGLDGVFVSEVYGQYGQHNRMPDIWFPLVNAYASEFA